MYFWRKRRCDRKNIFVFLFSYILLLTIGLTFPMFFLTRDESFHLISRFPLFWAKYFEIKCVKHGRKQLENEGVTALCREYPLFFISEHFHLCFDEDKWIMHYLIFIINILGNEIGDHCFHSSRIYFWMW